MIASHNQHILYKDRRHCRYWQTIAAAAHYICRTYRTDGHLRIKARNQRLNPSSRFLCRHHERSTKLSPNGCAKSPRIIVSSPRTSLNLRHTLRRHAHITSSTIMIITVPGCFLAYTRMRKGRWCHSHAHAGRDAYAADNTVRLRSVHSDILNKNEERQCFRLLI